MAADSRSCSCPWPGRPEECQRKYALRLCLESELATPPAPQAMPPVTLPDGWALETGVGGFDGTRWVCVRNLESQCGQDFYEDRDPLIFGFLNALAAIADDRKLRGGA